MENAADALKLAAGILIFLIAFAVLFNTTSLAKRTSELLVMESDKTTYMLYDEANGDDAWVKTDPRGIKCRIVTLEDIIPTLYRYSSESYGVTIIDKSKNGVNQIVARFDTETEGHCNNWNYDNYGMTNGVDQEGKITYGSRVGLIMHLNKYVLDPVGAYNLDKVKPDDLKMLFQRIYKQKIDGEYTNYSLSEFSCPWATGNSSETQEKFVAQRINSDLSRKFYNIFR